MTFSWETFLTLSMIFIGFLALLLIFREIVCWYSKINERRDLLKSIDEKLSVLVKNSKNES